MARRARDRLRRHFSAIGHLLGHGWQQSFEAAVPNRPREGHDHPQKPGSHTPRRRPLPPGCDMQPGRPSLRGSEPLPFASSLQSGVLQCEVPPVQCECRVGADETQGPAGRARRVGAVEATLSTRGKQGLLRGPAGRDGCSRLVTAERGSRRGGGGADVVLSAMRPGDSRQSTCHQSTQKKMPCKARTQTEGQKQSKSQGEGPRQSASHGSGSNRPKMQTPSWQCRSGEAPCRSSSRRHAPSQAAQAKHLRTGRVAQPPARQACRSLFGTALLRAASGASMRNSRA